MITQAPNSPTTISTGSVEIDRKLGGGIPIGSFSLIEGQSDAGKSVLSQHFTYGALTAGVGVAYYTTENTVKSLLTQMASLNLDPTDYFLVDRLRVYPVQVSSKETDAEAVFARLCGHTEALPEMFKVVIIDSLTNILTHCEEASIVDFFVAFKELCEKGRTVFMVVHSYAFDEGVLIRVRSLCDAHLKLKLEEVGARLIKVLEATKVRNAELSTGNIISFDVEPGMGMRIIPVTKAKA